MEDYHNCEDILDLVKQVGAVYVVDEEAKTLRFDCIGSADITAFINYVKQYGYGKGFKKLSIRVSDSQALSFFQHGFRVEASILAYYGSHDALFVVYYFDGSEQEFNTRQNDILEKALSYQEQNDRNLEFANITISIAANRNNYPTNVAKKVKFFGRGALNDHELNDTKQFTATLGGKVIASVTAQYNVDEKSVEFSDFTVNLEHDAHELISLLLFEMESFYLSKGASTAFTIVSANSLIMNSICAENHFEFGGMLKNESMIDGQLTNLNTWFKGL
ncbi:hypothetical protein [Thalassotalea marina]|uniref:Uncharacterized protein n=1 Tax=Thalassotalea marina TaxID=1673741 RepID=A0A919EMH8_9GAMM|nr:hypothetical protein [Thalassotalea marina]GHF98468.1 hypothetical protein GCM10017161_28720 [Thalassotalea marina]